MRTLLALSASCLVLASCATARSFASMSEEELIADNKGRPVMQQVYCTKEARTSSRIRKTYCDTVQGWITYNERQMMALETMNTPSASPLRGGN